MAVLQLPVIVSVDLDLRYGSKHQDPGRGGAEYVRRRFRDFHGPDGARLFELRDFRPESERFPGSSAKLTIPPTDDLLILDSAGDPSAASSVRLVSSNYSGAHNCGGIHQDNGALWYQDLTSLTRGGLLAGGTVLAIVDDDNILAVKQGHLVVRYGLMGASLDPANFVAPTGEVRPVIRLSNTDTQLPTAQAEAANQGLRVCSNFTDTFIYPEPAASGWVFPVGLGGGYLWVEASESGGKLGDVGYAVVVCGLKGERLPYFHAAQAGRHEECGTHATFVQSAQLVTVNAVWPAMGGVAYITIRQHSLSVSGAGIQIQFANLLDQWVRDPDLLPSGMTQFADAVKGAIRKAQMDLCTAVIYAKGVP